MIYPARPGQPVTVTVKDTTSAASSCNNLIASLDASNGTSDVLSGVNLSHGASQQFSGSSAGSDRYFVEVRANCEPAPDQPVTYTLTLASGGGGAAPAPADGAIAAGASIGDAWPPLQGKTSYAGTLASDSVQAWYVLYKKPDGNAATVRIEDTTIAGTVSCADVTVSLDAADGSSEVVSGANLGDNAAATLSVPGQTGSDPTGLYYLEVSSPECPDGGLSYRVEPEPSAEWQDPAKIPAGQATPGSSVGNAWPPLQGATSYNGTITSGTDENWYVLYKKPGTSPASVRVLDTTVAGSTSCTGVNATLDAADGPDDTVSGATLGDNSAFTMPITSSGSPDYQGRYYLEVQADNCPTGGATYRIEPDPATGWVSVPKPTSEPLPSGADKKAAGGPLTGGVSYDAALANAGTQDWSFFAASGSTPLTISVQDTTSSSDNCQEEDVTLSDASGVVSGATLGDDDGAELVVDSAKTFYLEISVADDCPPDTPLKAVVTLTPPKGVQSCSCSCGSAGQAAKIPSCLSIWAQNYRSSPAEPAMNITNETYPVMVGEKITLTARSRVGPDGPAVTWTIPGRTTAPPAVVASFGNVKHDLTGANPAPLTNVKQNPITFYLANAAAKTIVIKVSGIVGGKPQTAMTTLRVYTPTLVTPTATTCRVGANNHVHAPPVVAAGVYLGYNDLCGKVPGIAWNLKASVPQFAPPDEQTVVTGELALSQIINITATGTLQGASKPRTWSTRGKWCADTWSLYHEGTSLPLRSNASVTVRTGTANPAWQSLDVPGLGGLANGTSGTVSGAFRDYVLYRPANGIWVPLGGFTWRFSGGVSINAHGIAALAKKPAPTWPGSPKKTVSLAFLSRAALAKATGSWWPTWPGTFSAASPSC